MPFAGGGATVTEWKNVTVRWRAEFEKTVMVPKDCPIEPDETGEFLHLGEYLGVSGDLWDGSIDETIDLETISFISAKAQDSM